MQLRVEQLKLNHMYNIISGAAPDYLGSQIVMVHTQQGPYCGTAFHLASNCQNSDGFLEARSRLISGIR